MILLTKIDEVYCQIDAEEGILQEIKEKFTFKIEYYIPAKYRTWYTKGNEKKSLFNILTRKFYLGLIPELIEHLEKQEYEFKLEGDFGASSFSVLEAQEFIKTLNLPEDRQVRDYQLKYFIKCVRNKRAICLSPTNSGKSLIMYLLFRYYNEKTLVIVPYSNLVDQLRSDFESYGCKDLSKLLVDTWQSLILKKEAYFQNFRVVICDEVHHARCDSIMKIMKKVPKAPVRIGLTGTLSSKILDEKTIIGLFGPSCRYTTTLELINKGFSTNLMVKAICLIHEEQRKRDYEDEMNFILRSSRRNRFISRLALSLKGNTFIMFKNIFHGEAILKMINETKKEDLKVFYVDGSKDKNEREQIRQSIEVSKESITLASTVFATGVNISSIHNIIFVHPMKERIRILQAIGRGLRTSDMKDLLTVFDLYDNLNDEENSTFKHFKERQKIYKSEGFPLKNYSVNL